MKVIYTLLSLLFLLVGFSAVGQRVSRKVAGSETVARFQPKFTNPRNDVDTLFSPTFFDPCSQTVFAWEVDPWGFIAGSNSFLDREVSQFMIYPNETDRLQVTETLFFFSDASVVGDGEMVARVYSVADDEGPLDLLGTSQPVKASDIQVQAGEFLATSFVFSAPVEVPSNNVVHISLDVSQLYESRDTVNVFTTDNGCGSGTDTWTFLSDEVWDSFTNLWELESDIMAAAVVSVDQPTALNEPVSSDGFRLEPIFPNPASDQVRLTFELERPEELFLEVYRADGQRIEQEYLGRHQPGRYSHELDVDDLPAGYYLISLSDGRERWTTGLSVVN